MALLQCHVWADENPHTTFQGKHQIRLELNVWIGVLGDNLLGSHFLPPTRNGNNYGKFLENYFPVLLEDLPLQMRNNCILCMMVHQHIIH